ncbi:ethanolamine utilization protein EutH [Fournierella sp.]|uniref:ethanolamine utilization protein EutH n=1 Tax=Allofournierella sp. TaxID=1940256 RepID=UPI0025BD4D73|nr:ethanolamine utilization protein EutH [Fournierella sp.]
MEFIGNLITYIMMVCCVIGGISYIINDQSDLGSAFNDGLHAMANLFIPICGLMASVPYLKVFIPKVFGPIFSLFGADPAVAAAIIMPPDCGSFALATEIGQTPDLFPVIIAIGFMCASTIAFNVPIGLSMLEKEDHKYLALGTMSGFLSVPFGVLITSLIVMFTQPTIRSYFNSVGELDHKVHLTLGMILSNMIPLIVICVLLALGLKLFPNGMVKGFMVFGKLMTGALTLVVVACILQHYTGVFTTVFGSWGFDPILADEENTFRAIELLGTIAMMLTGAFPMIALIKRYLSKPLEKLGRLAGLEAEGSVGLVACLPNGLALFPYIKDMRAQDKVVVLAFLTCGGYCLGDFIAFNVNFQPNLLVPVFVGQVAGGIIGILFAKLLAVPQVKKMEAAAQTSKA